MQEQVVFAKTPEPDSSASGNCLVIRTSLGAELPFIAVRQVIPSLQVFLLKKWKLAVDRAHGTCR
jgi:hypothetical protein